MIYIPILGAFALATGTLMEKLVLAKRKISVKLYQTASFFAIILSMLPFIYFFWRMDAPAFELKNIFIFLLVIVASVIANLLAFYSLKREKISSIEPARILEPLFVVILAIIFSFFAEGLYERNMKIIIPALIAGFFLIFSHIEKSHLEFNRYFIAAMAGSFFFALELVISRLILDFYSSITFYFLRCSAIFIISIAIFRPKFSYLDKKIKIQIFITGIVWFVYRMVIYYGYVNYGIIFTTLMITLGPVAVYIFAYAFLKEKIGWKNILASFAIVASVVYAMIF